MIATPWPSPAVPSWPVRLALPHPGSGPHDWGDVRGRLSEDNLLQARTVIRRAPRRETVQRLTVFNDLELELLVEASPSERSLLLWVAACRRYTFIGEFAEEVVRERYLLSDAVVGLCGV